MLAVKSHYTWLTLFNSWLPILGAELCLALALDLFPGSVLNYSWHIKIREPWFFTARSFMAGYVHNRAFQDPDCVWTEAYSLKMH